MTDTSPQPGDHTSGESGGAAVDHLLIGWHQSLLERTSDVLDVETGLQEILLARHHTTVHATAHDHLDVESGLREVLTADHRAAVPAETTDRPDTSGGPATTGDSPGSGRTTTPGATASGRGSGGSTNNPDSARRSTAGSQDTFSVGVASHSFNVVHSGTPTPDQQDLEMARRLLADFAAGVPSVPGRNELLARINQLERCLESGVSKEEALIEFRRVVEVAQQMGLTASAMTATLVEAVRRFFS